MGEKVKKFVKNNNSIDQRKLVTRGPVRCIWYIMTAIISVTHYFADCENAVKLKEVE